METVKQILEHHSYESVKEMDTGTAITVEVSNGMDLVIEKIGGNRVSVGHYYTQHGDLMSDPEIVFQINGDEWIPVRYTHHPSIHEYDENGLLEAKKFATKWSKNLEREGYIEASAKDNPG